MTIITNQKKGQLNWPYKIDKSREIFFCLVLKQQAQDLFYFLNLLLFFSKDDIIGELRII